MAFSGVAGLSTTPALQPRSLICGEPGEHVKTRPEILTFNFAMTAV